MYGNSFADLLSDFVDLCSDFADLNLDFEDFDRRGDHEFSDHEFTRVDSDLISLNIKTQPRPATI